MNRGSVMFSLNRIRALRVSGSVLLLIVCALLYLIVATSLQEVFGETNCEVFFRPRSKTPFNKAMWIQSKVDGTRYAMANWMLDNTTSLPDNVGDITTLFGEPTGRELIEEDLCLDYILAPQHKYPAKSFLQPFGMSNMDYWYLRIYTRGTNVVEIKIIVK